MKKSLGRTKSKSNYLVFCDSDGYKMEGRFTLRKHAKEWISNRGDVCKSYSIAKEPQ